MKTAKTNRDEVRKKSLIVLMTQAEKDSVQKAADEKGLTVGAFVRSILKDYLRSNN